MSDLDFSSYPPAQLEDVLNGPALSPPKGVDPNFEHPWNENGISLFALVLCLTLSTVLLGLRIYVKFFLLKKQHIGDYLIFPAYVLYVVIAEGSLSRIASGPGLFVHQWDERGRDMPAYLLTIHLGIIFYCVSILLIKSSILIEWLHLFVPLRTRNTFYWCCVALLAVNGVFYITLFTISNLACTPYRRNWDKTVPGHCMDIKTVNLASAIVNLVLDLAILILPQRVIWGLQTTRKNKIGVSMVFAVGVAACIAAGCRIQANVQWIRSEDMTYHFSAVALWAIAEMTCGILILCIPNAPKALHSLGIPKWIISFSSWATVSTARLRWTRRSTRWSQSNIPPTGPRTYETIDGHESDAIGLTGMTSPPSDHHPSGILRTTDITTTAEARLSQGPQYPWDHYESTSRPLAHTH
ncbi:hypothetical protein F4778DRAFT_544867 [Xylariomycetidae sp. FL2044]|nr:hypothetical protein F4778DRAFT_544867 [Xylariomycetidae sp. FL2044]